MTEARLQKCDTPIHHPQSLPWGAKMHRGVNGIIMRAISIVRYLADEDLSNIQKYIHVYICGQDKDKPDIYKDINKPEK